MQYCTQLMVRHNWYAPKLVRIRYMLYNRFPQTEMCYCKVSFCPFYFFPRKKSTFLEISFTDSWFSQLLCFVLLDQVFFRKISNNHTLIQLTLYFSTPKMLGYLTSWSGWETQTNKLLDCTLNPFLNSIKRHASGIRRSRMHCTACKVSLCLDSKSNYWSA